jgi:hypothetical protein
MSRHSRYRKRKYKAIQKNSIVDEPVKVTERKVDVWKILGVIATITAIILSVNPIKDLFLTKKEKWDIEKTEQGTIEFPKITPANPYENNNAEFRNRFIYNHQTYHYPQVKGIYIKNLENMGSNDDIRFAISTNIIGFPKQQLESGINITSLLPNCDTVTKVWAISLKNRVYISAKFVDLRTGNEIGEMEFNHWKLYREEFMDYTYGEDRFEVNDKQGNIVFSIANISSGGNVTIAISGYFNSPNSISIYDDNVFSEYNCIQKSDSNWLRKAEIRVSKIKSVFPVKNK